MRLINSAIEAVEVMGSIQELAARTMQDAPAWRAFEDYRCEWSSESDEPEPLLYRSSDNEVVLQTVDDIGDLDLLCTYSDVLPGWHFRVRQEDGEQWIEVSFDESFFNAIIEDGRWYICSYA